MLFGKKENSQDKNFKAIDPNRLYYGNNFSIRQPEGWEDKTIHTLYGPIDDGIQHNIIISVEYGIACDTVDQYADIQIESLENSLKSFILLKRDNISLSKGFPAYKIIFRWYPAENIRLYQEQIYVLANKTAYKLTSTFTKKTRKTLGPQIERILMSFTIQNIQ
ncbi:MAG: DcrB-related protein [Candidatus Poribacteria bacterium]